MTLIAQIHSILLDRCTLTADGDEVRSREQRQRYISGLQRVLKASQLSLRSPQVVWSLGWDKPFFANFSAARASTAVDLARKAGVFDDFAAIASSEFLSDKQRGPLLLAAIEGGHLIGPCTVDARLERVQAYARAVPRITQSVNCFHADWQAGLIQPGELQARAVAIAEDIGIGGGPVGKVKGFGFITACHLLADLGLPLFKPDIWVCRIVSSLPGVQDQIRRVWQLGDGPVPFDFLESKLARSNAPDAYRRIVQPVMNALVEETQEIAVTEFDLAPAFLRTRFVDWTFAHFAISAESTVYGLARRPLDLLCSNSDPNGPEHIHALARRLADGQAAHEAQNALVNAKRILRKAKAPAEIDGATRRLIRLEARDARERRDALQAQALASSTAFEAAAAAAGWQIEACFPEGIAGGERERQWQYINKARSLKRHTDTA